RRPRAAGQAGADEDERVLPLVGGVDQLQLKLAARPLVFERPAGDFRVEVHGTSLPMIPKRTASGIDVLPTKTTTATTRLAPCNSGIQRGWLRPSDWNRLWKPWLRWKARKAIATMESSETSGVRKP